MKELELKREERLENLIYEIRGKQVVNQASKGI